KFTAEGSFEYVADGAGVGESQLALGKFGTGFYNGDQITAQATRSYERLKAPFTIARDVTLSVDGDHLRDVQIPYIAAVPHRGSGTVPLKLGPLSAGSITSVTVTGPARVSITPRFSFDPGLTVNHVDLPQGTFTTTLVTTRIDYAFSARMYLSEFLQ